MNDKHRHASSTPPRIALGCMGMSGTYGKTDDAQSTAVIHAAIERGVTLLDTGDFYGSGHNELLIGKAIAGRRDQVQLSVKFGVLRGPGGGSGGIDARPAAVKNFLAYSLVRLGTDHVDVYRPARLDPAVPIEDTIGAIADLVKAGYVRCDRALRGRPRDDPARGEGPSDRRSADRVLDREPRSRGRDLSGARGARHRRDAVRRAVARAALGAARSAPATRAPTCRGSAARIGEANARLVAGLQGLATALGHHAEPARDRLGARQAAAVRADARHAHASSSSTRRSRRSR